jgi:hypothetical protein
MASSMLWWRSWHGAPIDLKWSLIASKIGARPGEVSAIAWALIDHASQQKDRGSIDGFDVETYAHYSGFSDNLINRVIAGMWEKGVISNGRFASWEKRQPVEKSTERVRAFRERKKKDDETDETDETVSSSLLLSTLILSDSDSDSDSLTETGKEKDYQWIEREEETNDFDLLLRAIEQGVNITAMNPADIEAIEAMLAAHVIPADIPGAVEWHLKNKGVCRYISGLVGPAKTQAQMRIQKQAKGENSFDRQISTLDRLKEATDGEQE